MMIARLVVAACFLLPSAVQVESTWASTLSEPSTTATRTNVSVPPTRPRSAVPILPPLVTWQVQYTGELDTTVDVQVFNLDLFDVPAATIRALRERGTFVMCYFSAGSFEDWRPDAGQFPPEVLGNDMQGWPGEKWLDIRRLDVLGPIIKARLDLAVEKGCHGVDPDNVNGYQNETGFPLTGADQLVFNRFLATEAHRRGLVIGLKNDIEQAAELVGDFEWILNESCFTYQECEYLEPFKEAGKPVFVIEYDRPPETICPLATKWGYNTLIKHWELDAYRVDCHTFSSPPPTPPSRRLRRRLRRSAAVVGLESPGGPPSWAPGKSLAAAPPRPMLDQSNHGPLSRHVSLLLGMMPRFLACGELTLSGPVYRQRYRLGGGTS